MLFKIFTPFLLAVATSATALAHLPNATHPSCTFNMWLIETCHFTDKPALHTEAHIIKILSPGGIPVVNYTAGLEIDENPLTIHASRPQELIQGTLDIERPDNDEVLFGWTYGPSGGRPETTKWSESSNATEGRYGCRVSQDWDSSATGCDEEHPTGERNKFLDCWFRCSPVADSYV